MAAASRETPQPSAGQRIPGLPRPPPRNHGRTLDLLAGGLSRTHSQVEHSVLWVCDRCFKYMGDGTVWESHVVCFEAMWNRQSQTSYFQKKCTRKHPPGKKVYQRGAHTIWEVDGAKDKVRSSFAQINSADSSNSSTVKTFLYSGNSS